MDYDDNDFQSQSFQIAGEENTNFPLGLRSYSLPKFDIDDNLQVNLRFDSLVESEVLLGIQSQEQNQWIEDFSGGSSGIEFNSSAAESCSISRRNNVWSEATSSESVEMLLKSVGQDEMIMGQTILEESEPCDGLGNMANQMELKSSQDGYDPSKIGDVVDVKLTLPIDKSPENLSDLCTEAADQLPRIEATPKIDNVEISGTGSLVDLGQSSVSGQCSLAITEGNLFNDGRCYDANKKEEGLLDRSGGSNTLDYSNALVSNQLDSSHTSVQTFATNAGELSNQNVTLQVEGLQQDTTYNVGEHQARSEEAQMDDQICKNKAVETTDNNLLNSSGLALKVESTIPMTEVSSEVVFPDSSISVNKWQGIGSCNDAESIDQFVGSTQEASRFMVGRDNNSEALSVDLSSGGILSSPVQTMDPLPLIIQGKGNTKSSEKQGDLLEDDGQEYPFKQMEHGHSDIESTEKLRDLSHDDGQEYPFEQMAKGHGDIESTEKLRDLSQVDGHQLVRGISVSNTKSLTMDDHLFVKGQVDTINQVVSSSFVVDVCPSTSIIHVSKATENTKDGDKSDDVLGVRGVDIRREAPISSSMQICDKNLLGVESSSAHINISPLDVSFLDKENATLPNDPGSEGSEADGSLTVRKEVSSSSLGPSATSAAVMFDQTPSDQVLADESVSTDVIQDVCILTFNCKSDGAHPLPSSSNVTISEVIEYDEDAKSPLLGEDLACLDKKEETITELSAEPSSLVMKINPQMKNESVAVPELEQGAVCGNAREMLSETNGQSTSPFEAATAACQTEPHISIANNADNEGSKEECTVVSDSIMQESEGAEVVGVSSVEDQGAFLKTTGSLGETPLETVLSPLHDSSRDDGLTNLDCKVGAGNSKPGESLLADKGDPVNGCKDPCTPVTTLRDDSKPHSLEAASSYPNSSEPNCGSPTVISCNELPQSEIENQVVARGSLDQNAPASNDIDLVGNNIKTTAHNHKESHASQGDRNFTFEVISVADLAQRRADNEWKPFPSIQPYESPKIAQGSPPTTSSLHQNSHGSLLKSGGKHVPKTAKSNIGEKKTPLSGKTSRKTSNKGRPLKDELSKSEKEHQDGGMGCLDKNTPVSDHDPKENNVTGGDINFTFEVSSLAHLSGKETGHGLKPFACIQPYGFPQTVGASPSASGLSQIDPKILQEISRGSPRSSGVKNVRRNSKGNTEDRTRPVSGKAVDRETSKEGKHLKETTPTKFPKERGSNSPSSSPSSIGVMSRGFLQTEERRLFGYIEGSGTKPCVVPAVQTSKLPDLNTSASSSAFFHQPFSDFQQLQLRAQIFVYGSLIQGTAPEEACMVSAFGESDGGRNVWESVWRVTVERIQNQKSPLINPETPLHLHSGVRVPGQASKQIYQQSEMFSTPGRAGSKGGPSSAIVNPMNPLSSPVWTFSTPRDGFHSSAMMRGPLMDSHQTLLPLHPYQSPHLRHFIGNTTPWQSQVPSPATWVVTTPQTTALDTNVHYSAMPVSEAVHSTTVRESAVSHTSGMQPAPLSPVILNGGPISIPAGTPVSVDTIRTSVLPVKHVSSEGKPRKRKKSSNSVEPGEISSSAQPQAVAEPASSSFPLATSVAITTPASSMSKVTHGSFVLPTSPVSSTHHQILGGQDTDERVSLSEETCSKIEQAKQHAEDAAKHAASAVKHSENLWSQLALQKNSGLGLDVEAKLASSAVAIAAAAAVAKAASAVAKVAFDAALQAKLMADEALVTIKSGNPTSEASLHDGVRNLGNVTPASILKGKDRTNTSVSILVAAKETAKKRVEAASAATKRAENLDAVLRAAEMAAEAVSQAGTIVAMGDPIPLTLNELVAAGAEGYWKVQNIASEQHAKSKATNMDQSDIDSVEQGLDISAKQYSERQSKETKQTKDQDNVLPSKETSRQSADNSCLLNDSRWNSVTSSEKEVGEQNICQTSDTAKTIGVVPESQIGSANAYPSAQEDACEGRQPIRTVGGNSIEEGSTVEVLNYEGLRRVWFEAKVLSLKEGRAFVCYTELARDKGTDQQSKEWVPLEGEEGKAPRIRFPHPMSAVKYEGPGKRRREVRGDYTWSVGDRVDTWIHDGWWEAIIIEKPQETEMTVQFSVEGEKSLVRSWNLRPCVIWKDGQWMEWCSLKENNRCSHEGDTPREKRPKLVGNGGEFDPTVEIIGKDLKPMHMGTEALGEPEASLPLALSAKEKIFTMGKSIREDDKSNTQRTKRTGLQKEGSRVNLGVPKPGQKKRKFMDVSKHYVANRGGKPSEGSDSLRFANFLIPQESASRGWKNPPKVVSKGKQVAEPKPKGLKMGKPQSLGRNTFEKDSSSSSVFSASKEGTVKDRVSNDQASVSRGGNVSEKQKLVDPGSFHSTRKTAEAQPSLSSSDAPCSKKKPSSFAASNLGNKGKVTASGEMLARIDENDAVHHDNPGKSLPGAAEPRRSNRRIQPTSRLLEGLQSSLTISKIPQISHDRGGTRTQPRSATNRGGNHG